MGQGLKFWRALQKATHAIEERINGKEILHDIGRCMTTLDKRTSHDKEERVPKMENQQYYGTCQAWGEK